MTRRKLWWHPGLYSEVCCRRRPWGWRRPRCSRDVYHCWHRILTDEDIAWVPTRIEHRCWSLSPVGSYIIIALFDWRIALRSRIAPIWCTLRSWPVSRQPEPSLLTLRPLSAEFRLALELFPRTWGPFRIILISWETIRSIKCILEILMSIIGMLFENTFEVISGPLKSMFDSVGEVL